MAVSVSRPVQVPPEPFNRTPYLFTKSRLDDMGNEITETYYSVAGRKEEFRYLFPNGYYLTEIVEKTPNFVLFRCSVYLDKDDLKPYRIAHATRELDTTSEIGRRFIECAETAAIGRALANAGIGADALLDDLDKEEQQVTGGTPLGKNPDPAVKGKSGSETAPKKNERQKQDAGEKSSSMTDEEALAVEIISTESKSLKGKTFGQAIQMVKDEAKFKSFLSALIKNGQPLEKAAAQAILAKFTEAKAA